MELIIFCIFLIDFIVYFILLFIMKFVRAVLFYINIGSFIER